MFGYKVKLPTVIPQPIWAAKVTVDDYQWKNTADNCCIEFAIVTADSYYTCFEGQPRILQRGQNIHCVVGDVPMCCMAEPGIRVEIATVAVTIPGLQWEAKELTGEDFADSGYILLPSVKAFSEADEMREYEVRVHQYIHAYMNGSHAEELLRYAIIYDLLYRLDTMVRQSAGGMTDKYLAYYVKKADYAMQRRFSEKLTVSELAKDFGITPNYLSAIYREAYGVTFSHRLTDIRIGQAKHLLLHSDLHLAQIAIQVGYSSESHLRKRFRQHVGISITEFLCINKEQTLYHDKPLRISDEVPMDHKIPN
ncbi:MAG: helix-turn-helix transcriptional regulator [Oscillospiraceae bacterium]|nr:helix-turn-helix transcriptional regulator [Oscillospiraceae bacterium]